MIKESTHANYLKFTLDPEKLEEMVEKAANVIEEKFPNCEYIAAMGISGLSILPAISLRTKKKMYIVRKDDDVNNHSFRGWDLNNKRKEEYIYTGNDNPTAVIIDDLISSGATMNKICHKLFMNDVLVEGIILYCDGSADPIFPFYGMDIPVYSIGEWEE